MLVFVAMFSGGSGIFTPAEVLVQTGDVIGGKTITGFTQSIALGGSQPLAINNAGGLVFAADFVPGVTYPSGQQLSSGAGILTTSNLLVQTNDVTTPFGTVDRAYSPALNDLGALVFGGSTLGDTFNIYNVSGPIATSAPDQGFDDPVINNSGSVVFWSEFGGGLSNITAIRTPTETLAFAANPGGDFQTGSIAGQKLCGVGPAVVNNAGALVFGARFQTSVPYVSCLSSGLATISEILVQSGDSIASKVVALNPGLALDASINDAGTIVFAAFFTDGSSGIVMATPIASGIAGDVNGDGAVDCTDLAIVTASFSRKFGRAGFNPRADVNADGVIDIRDLAFVAQRITAMTSCPP